MRRSVCFFLCFSSSVLAQLPDISAKDLGEVEPPDLAQYEQISLYPSANTIADDSEQWFHFMGQKAVRNVVQPTLTVFPPEEENRNGVGVIVAPGGGFNFISWSNEGVPTADWLTAKGYTVFVLKYRTKETPRSDEGYFQLVKEIMKRFVGPTAQPGFSKVTQEAQEDVLTAIEYVRENSEDWQLKPNKIGVLGYSAGAIAGLEATLVADASQRPDFLGLIYGNQAPRQVPDNPPPLFTVRALDDTLYLPLDISLEDSFGLLAQWQRKGGSVETHLYSTGGHGFGMPDMDKNCCQWVFQFYFWLEEEITGE